MLVKPNLYFNGQAEEAIDFYTSVFGVKAENVFRYADAPPRPGMPSLPEELGKRIANSRLNFGGSFFNISDVMPPAPVNRGDNFRMDAVFEGNSPEIERVFAGLAEGGTVTQPLGKVYFSPAYGELTDRYGIRWAVMGM